MLRIKRLYSSLLLYTALAYTCLLATRRLTAQPGDPVTYSRHSFQRLDDEVTVLTAYYDPRPTVDPLGPPWTLVRSPRVRVLTIAPHRKADLYKRSARDLQPKTYRAGTFNITCSLVWGEGEQEQVDYEAVVLEEGGEQFAATFINCFSPPGRDQPRAVVLATGGNEVRVEVQSTGQYSSTSQPRDLRAAVCVRPIFGHYDNVQQISQFVAYYSSVLGVDSFQFYLLEASPRVKALMASLQDSTLDTGVTVEVTSWQLEPHLRSWEVLWDSGALLALTDCVYRSMATHGFSYIVDLDEFIVPREALAHHTTPALVSKIAQFKRAPGNKSTDAFLFKNTFFCSEFNEGSNYDQNFDVFSLKKREDFYWSFQLRAKMLVKSQEVVAVGHHRIHDWVKPQVSFNTPIPQQVAVMHHYRSCEGLNTGFSGKGSPVLKNNMIIDESIKKFQKTVEDSPVMAVLKMTQV